MACTCACAPACAHHSLTRCVPQATVVGSSVYNILVIIGWSAIAGKDILLDWKPLVRDSCFYFITIFFLLGTFSNPAVHLLQSLIAVLLYASYVAFMSQNQKVFQAMDAWAVRGPGRVTVSCARCVCASIVCGSLSSGEAQSVPAQEDAGASSAQGWGSCARCQPGDGAGADAGITGGSR